MGRPVQRVQADMGYLYTEIRPAAEIFNEARWTVAVGAPSVVFDRMTRL
jgi:hypothetical protein